MIYRVFLLAFGGPGQTRLVSVADKPRTREELLEVIFYYGQNDIQPAGCCSVSVGDVIELPIGGQVVFYRVTPDGFERVQPTGFATREELANV